MKNHIIISLLILSVGLSQQIITTQSYKNGNVKSITYHKKTRDGIQKVKEEGYHEKGQKEFEGSYKDGKKEGLWTYWNENGQKKEEGNINDDRKDGLWTYWYENGKKKSEGILKDRKLDGLWIKWYENGQKQYEGTFKDGKEISKKEWNEDGSVKE